MKVNITRNVFLDYKYFKMYDQHPLFTPGDRLNTSTEPCKNLNRHNLLYRYWVTLDTNGF